MPVTVGLIIQVTLIVLFLLYAYSMIGGYTPINQCTYPGCQTDDRNIKSNLNPPSYPVSNVSSYIPSVRPSIQGAPGSNDDGVVPTTNFQEKTIYQMGPYLDI